MAVSEEIQEKMLEEATSATPNWSTDYTDERFDQIDTEYKDSVNDLDETYGGIMGNVSQQYEDLKNATAEWADKQSQLQQDRTDFAIEQIEQQKDKAHKDYLKEQSGAYVDWQKQSNQFGVEAERMAAAGLDKSGYSESSQVSMYNTYQNRIAVARESYNNAVLNYNNAIKDAQIQNNAALAEIAYNSLQKQLELSLEGTMYENQLLLELADKKQTLKDNKWQKEQAIIQQQNWEKQMAENRWQYEDNQRFTAEQNQADRAHQEKLQLLDQEFDAKQNQLNRDHDKAMAALEQEYKIKYLDAQTAKEKELLKIQHQNDIAKLNKQLENDKALLAYQKDLNKAQITGGNTGSKGTTYSRQTYVKKATNDEARLHNSDVGKTSNKNLPLNKKSILNLGYGPISNNYLAKLVAAGEVKMVEKNGEMHAVRVKKGIGYFDFK